VAARNKTPKSPETIEAVRQEYLGGQRSLRQIGATYGIDPTTITEWVKKYGWGPRKLAERVREEAHAQALKQDLPAGASDAEIIAELGSRGADVLVGERRDIAALRQVGETLRRQLEGGAEEKLSVRANVYLALAQAMAKLIPLERKANNLDATEESAEQAIRKMSREQILGELASLGFVERASRQEPRRTAH
jgi:hypothetical protein